MEELFDELVATQKKRLLELARLIVPSATADDIMQPNDFPELEGHPEFRYEEGVLEGVLTARMAYLAKRKELDLAC
ncbi:MAG: hypothetical protein NTX49_10580 [Chlamydiae bacterium]|nr:hypothetical protein [Chlamydiota bacterium]